MNPPDEDGQLLGDIVDEQLARFGEGDSGIEAIVEQIKSDISQYYEDWQTGSVRVRSVVRQNDWPKAYVGPHDLQRT